MFSQASLGQELTTDESLTIFYNQSKLNPTSPSATMFSEEDNKVRLLVFPANMNNATLGNIEDIVDEDDNSYITGVQFLMKDLNEQISQMQLYSILIALGAVLVMLIITIKSLKISVISLLPIILSILGVYAFLGISQISLNVTTTIIFSITIGVVIDYAVHFSSVYKVFLDENMTKNQAVVKAYKYTSRPIIANALGISIGFTILMLSPLRIHFNVAVLMWVSMGVSVLMTLTLLPTLLGDMPKRR